MIIAVISDTHTPECIEKAFTKLQELTKKHSEISTVAINGDLLGIFSVKEEISKEKRADLLQEVAPLFTAKFSGEITPELGLIYIKERYDWVINILKKFKGIIPVIFNLGNHESEKHFLVIQELKFLTGHDVPRLDSDQLMAIFKEFESELQIMESNGNFNYIRNKHLIIDKTMILGIPGISHDTVGNDEFSLAQEAHTRGLVNAALKDLDKVSQIIILNHTQGDTNKQTGIHNSSSKSLKEFMNNIPMHILQSVYIQSHNHFLYSHFQKHHGFHYLLNNAGIHNGRFNLLSINSLGVQAYDVAEVLTPLMLNENFSNLKDEEARIARSYKDPKPILSRMSGSNESEFKMSPELIELKKKVMGIK